jgi:hypothetical protein
MGQSVFPAPVVSTTDTWTLIQTNTTTSGATSTFSSLSGYKKYMVAWEGITVTGNGNLILTFNGSTSNYFGGVVLPYSGNYQTSKSGIKLNWTTFLDNSGFISIDNANNGIPKIVRGELLATPADWIEEIRGGWTDTSTITSIVFTTPSTYVFSAGTMRLYGVAA